MSANYINKITDTGGTVHDIMEGVDTRIFRATCSTDASTAAKVATLDDATGFTLVANVRVAVTFTYGNSATTPTLNVNGTGAANIVVAKTATDFVSGNGTTYNTWGPNETVIFTYTGTYWVNGGSARSIYNAYNNNTNTVGYNIRMHAGTHILKTALYRYQYCFSIDEQNIVPVNAVSNSTATTKTLTTESFDPFGTFYYYSTTTTVAAGTAKDYSNMWTQYYSCRLDYSFNTGTSLVAGKKVYLVCVPQSDGKVKLHSSPISQSLPTTEDGLVYIHWGVASNTTTISFELQHPVYYYAKGGIRQWTGGLFTIDDKTKLNKYPSTSTSQSGNFLKVNSSGNVEVSNITVDTALTQSELDSVLTGSATPASYYSVVNRNDIDAMTAKLVELNAPTRLTSGAEEGTTYGAPPLVLLHFSDIHGDSQRVQNIVNFKSYYANRINDIICTGDIVNYSVEDGLGFWTGVSGSESILTCIGNHDSCMVNASDRTGSNWMKYTMSECYQMYMADNIASWGATYTSGQTYYYKDYTTQGVRLIVLDIMRNISDSNQLTWFTNTLASARTAGLHVIVAAHGHAHWRYMPYDTPWDTAKLAPGKVSSQDHYEYYPKKGYAYMGGEGATFEDASTASRGTDGTAGYPSNFGTSYMEAVQDFIDAGGNFVCWLHGHTHYKMFARLLYYPDQLDVSVAQAGCPPFANSYTNYREEDTRTEDDFELVAIDTTSKTLRIAQVGIDHDRYMRPWESISYDYGTHELMSPAEDQPTDLLFQGAINSSTTTLTLPNAMRYQQIVVVGKSGAASSGKYLINSVRPITTSALTTSAVNYTLTGGSATFTFSVKYSGSNIVITYVSETTSDKGAITAIYGHM